MIAIYVGIRLPTFHTVAYKSADWTVTAAQRLPFVPSHPSPSDMAVSLRIMVQRLMAYSMQSRNCYVNKRRQQRKEDLPNIQR